MQKILSKQYDITVKALQDLSFLSNDSIFTTYTDMLIESILSTSTEAWQKNSVYFTGIGKNDTIAEKTANMFRSLNFNAHNLNSVHAMHGDLGTLRAGDVIVAISKSGNTSELSHFLQYVNQNYPGVTVFGIQVSSSSSKFYQSCNYIIQLPEVEELDEFNKVPTTSNIITQLYFDAVAIRCAEAKNFSIDQFVKSHPCGTIGGRD